MNMQKSGVIAVLSLALLAACDKREEPPPPPEPKSAPAGAAVQADSHLPAVSHGSTATWTRIASAKAANKPVFLYWGSGVVPALCPDQVDDLQQA
jgi:hypothetical protein